MIETEVCCRCVSCRSLRSFCADPEATTLRLPVPKEVRQHLREIIDMHGLDMIYETERIGMPHTLGAPAPALWRAFAGPGAHPASVFHLFRFPVIWEIMKTVINVTKRGVLTLPVRLRKQLGLTADNLVIAESTPDGVLLRPAVALPIEIYTDERVREFNESEAELAAELDSEKRPG